jgi:hypothetical protein
VKTRLLLWRPTGYGARVALRTRYRCSVGFVAFQTGVADRVYEAGAFGDLSGRGLTRCFPESRDSPLTRENRRLTGIRGRAQRPDAGVDIQSTAGLVADVDGLGRTQPAVSDYYPGAQRIIVGMNASAPGMVTSCAGASCDTPWHRRFR